MFVQFHVFCIVGILQGVPSQLNLANIYSYTADVSPVKPTHDFRIGVFVLLEHHKSQIGLPKLRLAFGRQFGDAFLEFRHHSLYGSQVDGVPPCSKRFKVA